jgi:two-component system response regulator
VFRILIVDDDPVFVGLLRLHFRKLTRACEIHEVKDGAETLDFLYRRDRHANAPVPDLIFMDLNLPGMNALEALGQIKSQPALSVIPVIVLSTLASPPDLRKIYQAHASCFIQKPSELERFDGLVRAIEAFWMDFAILPSHQRHVSRVGLSVAMTTGEAWSRAISTGESSKDVTASGSLRCVEEGRLMEEFAAAVKDLMSIHEEQFQAILQGDPESNRFDLLIHMANERKQQAKYNYLSHVETHSCWNIDVITNNSGT